MECERCTVAMRIRPSAIPGVFYYHCPRCGCRLTSDEPAVFRRGAGVRPPRQAGSDPRWDALRARAEAWFERLESMDPYRVLGLRPGTDFAVVRARFQSLAARHHPDRGGDPTRMRELIEAYQAIRRVESQRREEAESRPSRRVPVSAAAAAPRRRR